MKKEQLIESLKAINPDGDEEINHQFADRLLLAYIDDEEVTKTFDGIKKWYS